MIQFTVMKKGKSDRKCQLKWADVDSNSKVLASGKFTGTEEECMEELRRVKS